MQVQLQRSALTAGHAAYVERVKELRLLKLHLANALREVRLCMFVLGVHARVCVDACACVCMCAGSVCAGVCARGCMQFHPAGTVYSPACMKSQEE